MQDDARTAKELLINFLVLVKRENLHGAWLHFEESVLVHQKSIHVRGNRDIEIYFHDDNNNDNDDNHLFCSIVAAPRLPPSCRHRHYQSHSLSEQFDASNFSKVGNSTQIVP
mmetsp:Transcript_21675/g.61713  ORF Transcript_21675/g.61713 Transcript_21675/m.61713 type:complete len:112 (-) Transcript_21675:123-458(-)